MAINQTTLAQNPELYNETIRVIEKSFNYPSDQSFKTDFYNLLEPNNHRHNHLLIDGNNVVAHIGVNLRELYKDGISCHAAFIGGVAVNPDYRGRGLFKNLFKSVLDKYKDKCAFSILWSDNTDLYEKFNFYEFGSILQTGNKDLSEQEANVIGFNKVKLSKLPSKDFEQLHFLYKKNYKSYIGPKRNQRSWDVLSHIDSTDLYIKRDHQQKIEHYFFINKGHDLSHIIHECSFYNDEVLINKFKEYKLWLPEKHRSYIDVHQSLYTGIIQITNFDHFSSFVHEIFNKDLEIKNINNQNTSFLFKGEDFEVTTEEFIKMIFGPHPTEEFVPYSNWFFIPGLDSV